MRRLLVLLVVASCHDESVPIPLPMLDEPYDAGELDATRPCETTWVCCGPRGAESCPLRDDDGGPPHCLIGEHTGEPGSCAARK